MTSRIPNRPGVRGGPCYCKACRDALVAGLVMTHAEAVRREREETLIRDTNLVLTDSELVDDPVHVAARTLHALLTGRPRHTVDSAPVREAVKALGAALGVKG